MSRVTASLLIGLLVQNTLHAQEKELQGKWKMVAGESKGKAFDLTKECPVEMSFDGDRAELILGEEKWKCTIKTDDKKTPHEIDFLYLDGKLKGRVNHGIYQIRDAKLFVCVSHKFLGNEGSERPREFKTDKSQKLPGLVMFVLEKK